MEKVHIAIDGPAGAGKSTIAKMIAEKLEITYIDTGAMYRALTLELLNKSIDMKNTNFIINKAEEITIELDKDKVYIDGKEVTKEIRKPIVNENVSKVAQVPEVRKRMTQLQQLIAQDKSVVMDGRDIGTQVLPNAKYKFFLVASIEERSQRRYAELSNKGFNTSIDKTKEEMILRDKMDTERTVSPLKPAEEAIIIDTTSKSIDEVLEEILSYIEGRS